MKLQGLTLKDKELFDDFLGCRPHDLSVYAFENIYIWKALFDIYWAVIEDCLCVFFQDKIGTFLYLPPLGKQVEASVVQEAFRIMDKFNRNKEISRIENIEEKDLFFYRELDYACKYKSCDYVCRREDLVQLKGNKFKSKRACVNHFARHYEFQYLAFSLPYATESLRLYNRWLKDRKAQNTDIIYQGMLEDNRKCLKLLLENYSYLHCIGGVVKVDKAIKAFTFGFHLNPDTFCILYEIADLSAKGLSQFIFHRFCSELKDYRYINIMDDSGLENLKRTKLSYHPVKLIPAYIATRKNE